MHVEIGCKLIVFGDIELQPSATGRFESYRLPDLATHLPDVWFLSVWDSSRLSLSTIQRMRAVWFLWVLGLSQRVTCLSFILSPHWTNRVGIKETSPILAGNKSREMVPVIMYRKNFQEIIKNLGDLRVRFCVC